MLPDPVQSTSDLRSRAQERKRNKEQKAKWQPAWALSTDHAIKVGPNNTQRPRRLQSKGAAWIDRRDNNKEVHRHHVARKQEKLNSEEERHESGHSSSSASEPDQDDIQDFVRDEEPEVRGQTILALALDKALVKFEDHQTTMLVKNEYEVLEDDDIEKDGADDLANEDDDYELV